MILTKMIKSKDGVPSMKVGMTGDNIILSTKMEHKSEGIIALGIATWTIGAVIIMPAIAVIGGAMIVAGGVYSITASSKIKKAGEFLKKKNYTQRPYSKQILLN